MARVLLVKPNPPFSARSKVQPLGILYLAAALRGRTQAHEVALLDARISNLGPGATLEHIRSYEPDIVGFSCMSAEYPLSASLARQLKQVRPFTVTVLGGPHVACCPEQVAQNPDFDFAVSGEGEETFPALIEALEGQGELSRVAGIAYAKNGVKEFTAPRAQIADLDRLPFPAWDLLDLEQYSRMHAGQRMLMADDRFMPILTSRGCPYRCTYCFHPFGARGRLRSADNVFREMQTIHARYGITSILVLDDIFNLDQARAEAICDRIIESGIPFKLGFMGGLRVDLMSERLLRKLKEAGTYTISYAIETAVPRLQRVIKKNINPHKAADLIAATTRQGILTTGFFMVGLPTETVDDVYQTIEFAVRSSLNMACFSSYHPFPGTEGYRQLQRQGYPVGSLDPCQANLFKPAIPTNGIGVHRLSHLMAVANLRFMLSLRRFMSTIWLLPRKRFLWAYALSYLFRIRAVRADRVEHNRAVADERARKRRQRPRSKEKPALEAA